MFRTIATKVHRFIMDEDGPTAIEYAVVIMGIFLAVIATVQLIGQLTSDSFNNSNDAIQEALANSGF